MTDQWHPRDFQTCVQLSSCVWGGCKCKCLPDQVHSALPACMPLSPAGGRHFAMSCPSSICRRSTNLILCTPRPTACTEQPRLLMRQNPTRRGAVLHARARLPRGSAPPSASWAWARVRIQGRGSATVRCNVPLHVPAVLMMAIPTCKHQGGVTDAGGLAICQHLAMQLSEVRRTLAVHWYK